jgi:hypothetical protein
MNWYVNSEGLQDRTDELVYKRGILGKGRI